MRPRLSRDSTYREWRRSGQRIHEIVVLGLVSRVQTESHRLTYKANRRDAKRRERSHSKSLILRGHCQQSDVHIELSRRAELQITPATAEELQITREVAEVRDIGFCDVPRSRAERREGGRSRGGEQSARNHQTGGAQEEKDTQRSEMARSVTCVKSVVRGWRTGASNSSWSPLSFCNMLAAE